MAKRRRKKSKAPTIVIGLLIVGVLVFLGFRFLHTCDDCGKFFVGIGYRPNKVAEVASDILSEKQKIICRDCAGKQYVINDLFGKDIKEYRLGLFEFGID